jgi:type IV pilus assembly protein PilC
MANTATATAELKRQGFTILTLTEAAEKKGFSLSDFLKSKPRRRVKTEELGVFTRQLATMISAGIPLLESLEILQEQTDNAGFQLVLGEVVDKVRGGSDFSESLNEHPKIFSRIYVSMVRAGEAGGQLDAILTRLAEFLESAEALKRDIKSAMTYPVISLSMIILIVVGLMVGIIPKFQAIFVGLGIPLPLPTKIVLGISKVMTDYFLVVGVVIIILVIAFILFKKSVRGQYTMDWLVLRLPIFGDLFKKVAVSRFSRTFSTLIKSGVPILGALEIVAATSGNRLLEDALNEARDHVRKGETLSEPLSHSGIFPPMVTRMIGIGEKSGALEALLSKISEFYDQQVKATVESLTSMIEPIMIGMMGVLVGGIVLAVFLPIFSIQKAVGKK